MPRPIPAIGADYEHFGTTYRITDVRVVVTRGPYSDGNVMALYGIARRR